MVKRCWVEQLFRELTTRSWEACQPVHRIDWRAVMMVPTLEMVTSPVIDLAG